MSKYEKLDSIWKESSLPFIRSQGRHNLNLYLIMTTGYECRQNSRIKLYTMRNFLNIWNLIPWWTWLYYLCPLLWLRINIATQKGISCSQLLLHQVCPPKYYQNVNRNNFWKALAIFEGTYSIRYTNMRRTTWGRICWTFLHKSYLHHSWWNLRPAKHFMYHFMLKILWQIVQGFIPKWQLCQF